MERERFGRLGARAPVDLHERKGAQCTSDRAVPARSRRTPLRLTASLVLALLVLATLPPSTAAAQLPLISGTVLTTNPSAGVVTIKDSRGQTAAYSIAPGAELIVYDRPARLADLLPGMDVWFYARQGQIVLLSAPATWQSPATAPPVTAAPQRVAGRLQYVDGNTVGLIEAGGEIVTYSRTAQTEAYRGGVPVPVAALDPGDYLTVMLSSGDTIGRIDATPAPYPAAELYRGRVQSTWPTRRELVLTNVERLTHGRWQPVQSWQRFPVTAEANLYRNGDPSDLADIGRAGVGQTAYIAVAPDGAALKVSVLPAASAVFMSSPAGVSYGRSEIVFPDEHGAVVTGPSSILIRNGRLVDFYGLTADGGMTVALGPAPGTGLPDQLAPGHAPTQYAAAAVQETYMPYGLTLHFGRLHAVSTGQVTLRDPHAFVPYQFERTAPQWNAAVTLNYGLAVQGRDLRSGAPGKPFDRFALDQEVGLPTTAPGRMTGSWVVAASRNGEIVALDAIANHPGLAAAVVTAGVTGESAPGTVKLEAPVTWNAIASRWEPDNITWPLNVSPTALWLGPDGPIQPESVAPGTRITVIRTHAVQLVLIR